MLQIQQKKVLVPRKVLQVIIVEINLWFYPSKIYLYFFLLKHNLADNSSSKHRVYDVKY